MYIIYIFIWIIHFIIFNIFREKQSSLVSEFDRVLTSLQSGSLSLSYETTLPVSPYSALSTKCTRAILSTQPVLTNITICIELILF